VAKLIKKCVECQWQEQKARHRTKRIETPPKRKKRKLKRGTAKKGSCLFPCFCVCFAVSGKKEVKYKHSTKYRQQQFLFAFMNNGALLKTGRHGRNI